MLGKTSAVEQPGEFKPLSALTSQGIYKQFENTVLNKCCFTFFKY